MNQSRLITAIEITALVLSIVLLLIGVAGHFYDLGLAQPSDRTVFAHTQYDVVLECQKLSATHASDLDWNYTNCIKELGKALNTGSIQAL